MDNSIILEAIKQRRSYPLLGAYQDSEIKYAKEVLQKSDNFALLVFPVGILLSLSRQAQELRKNMFDNWHVGGIFDIGSLFEPSTAIRFSLVLLIKQPRPRIYFGSFSGKLFSSVVKRDFRKGEFGEMPSMSPEFDSYLKSIEVILAKNQTPDSTDFCRFFSIETQTFNKDYLNIEYYDPELIKNEEVIKSQKWVSLSSVAEVLLPRSTQNSGRNLYSKYFDYPLPNNIPLSNKGTNIVLQKGDILVASIGFQKAYLVHDEPPYKDLHPSPTFFVIRPKSEVVTSYYLFLYLQSDTARKYAERYKKGVIFQRVNLLDLRDFPIVLPDLATQEYSQVIFEKMFLKSGKNQLDLFNDLLFSKREISEKQVQKEFVLEELETVRLHKRDLISSLLIDDFKEINQCLNVNAYKSVLILCGSILEAILLDWLSEIEQRNYFEEEKDPNLSEVIRKLQAQLGAAKDEAIRIKDKRNLVHPRRLLRNLEKIDKKLCGNVISDLRVVLQQRGVEAA